MLTPGPTGAKFVHDGNSRAAGRRARHGGAVEALSMQLAEVLQGRILDGTYEVETQLPSERQLEQEFAMSRTVVREAVKLLAARGLVYVQQGRGTFVAEPHVSSIADSISIFAHREDIQLEDVLVVRRTLETEIAALAALHRRPEDVEEMWRGVEEMERHLDDTDRYLGGVHRFHRAMAEASGNRVFVLLIDAIEDLLHATRRTLSQIPGAREAAVLQHKAIADAVKWGDVAKVSALTAERLELMAVHTAQASHVSGAHDESLETPSQPRR
jgi:GntR family transcriptional repressor for pyruvate dehydrogenase complex